MEDKKNIPIVPLVVSPEEEDAGYVQILSNNPSLQRYKVAKDPLAEGSMSTIFSATRNGTEYVLKIDEEEQVPGVKSVSELEAEAMRSVNLEAVPDVYDVGVGKLSDKDKLRFLYKKFAFAEFPMMVMEKVVGKSILYMYMDDEMDSVSKLAPKILRSVAEVIDVIASKGIRHRDISSANIIVDEEGGIKLIDWGISTSVVENRELDISYDGSYMPPEIGQIEQESVASDVFELAVLTYAMISGGESPYGNMELEDKIGNMREFPIPRLWKSGGLTKTPYESLGTKDLLYIDHDDALIAELDNIFLKALSIEASERYQSANDFVEDITKAIARTDKKWR